VSANRQHGDTPSLSDRPQLNMREEIVDEKVILSREFFDIFQGPVYKKRNFSQLLARDVRVYTVMIYHVIGLHTHTHTPV